MKQLIQIFVFVLIFIGSAFSQKYFLPIPVESSNGRPIKNEDVDLYQSGSKIEDLTWLDAGRYYWSDTSAVPEGSYDVYVNDLEWQTNVMILYTSPAYAISHAPDTSAMKALDRLEGHSCLLKQLASGNSQGVGWFISVDSTHIENGIIAYDHYTSGLQWGRVEFIENYTINVLWAGAKGDGLNDDTEAIQACMDLARDLQIDVTDDWTGLAADRRPIKSPKVIIPMGVSGKYLITSPITVYGGTDIEFQKSALMAGTSGMVMVNTLQTSASNPVATYATRNINIKDMTLWGNGIASAGLFLRNVSNGSTVEGLRVYGVKGKIFADSVRTCDIPTQGVGKDTIIVSSATGLLPNQILEIDGRDGFYSIQTINTDTVILNRNMVPDTAMDIGEDDIYFHIRPVGLQIGRCIGLNVLSPEIRLNTLGVFVGDDSSTGRSAKVQFYGAFIEHNDWGLYLGGADDCSFYGCLVQNSRRGWEVLVSNRAWNNSFYNLYVESINTDTLDEYSFRTTPVIYILDDASGTSFHGLRYPQNPTAVGWRRVVKNSGDNTFINGLNVTPDSLIVNPNRDNDYALVEQNSTTGHLIIQSSSGSDDIHNPYLYVIDENGEYPNDRVTVVFQWNSGQRISGKQRVYSDTGSDDLLSFYKTDTTWTSTASRLWLAINGIHIGHTDTVATSTRIYSDATNRLRLETGDTFFLNTAWDGGLFRLNSWRFWEDAGGYLRAKGTGDPSSDLDGDEVFTPDSTRVYDGKLTFYYEDSLYFAVTQDSLLTDERTQEEIEDWVGGMFEGNTETNISLTYQDVDGTIDAVAAADSGSQWADSISHDGRKVTGDSVLLDAEAIGLYQPLETTLTDIADGTIAENLVNTANPWVANEIISTMMIEGENINLLDAGNTWRTFYSDGSNDIQEVTIGASGTFLGSNGAAVAPTFQTPPVAIADTLSFYWGVQDTVLEEDLVGYKIPWDATIIEISSYTDNNTTTFNIEERGESTPNSAGTDALAADQVADTNGEQATSFSNADFTEGTWITPSISTTGDVARFSIAVKVVKQ